MVERRKELDARYHRKEKMRKLKAKLQAPGADRDKILAKIRRISPWWTEASLATADPAADGGPPAEPAKKPPAGPRPKKA